MSQDAFLIITVDLARLPPGLNLSGGTSPDPSAPSGVALTIFDFAFSVQDPASLTTAGGGTAGGGTGAGKVQFAPLVATRTVDSSSPALLPLLGFGTSFPRMELYIRPSAGSVTTTRSVRLIRRCIYSTASPWLL